MKEIMDTSLVEGYIFFFEVLDMVGKECQHILLAVIGFLAQCLVGQCADTAVALQCALAYLEQHAQILIVEKADAFRDSRLFPLSLHRQQQFVLTVEPFHQLLHPALEVVSCEQFHDLCPPSFWFAASAQRVVAFQFLRCRRVLVDGTRFKLMNETNDVFTMEDEPIASVMQDMRKGSKWLSVFLESYRPPLDGERYLTDGEVAELLRVSRRTLQEYRNNRVLSFILLGGKVLYPETGLREVLEANYRKPLE